jgi:hypothetical protein
MLSFGRSRQVRVAAVVALACAGAVTAGVPVAQAAPVGPGGPGFSVIAGGLNNPRGVVWSHGRLYVAQAGTGGADCPAGAVGGDGGPACFGLTGAITELTAGHRHDLVSGLFSAAGKAGVAAEGVSGLTATGAGLRTAFGGSVVGTLAAIPKGSELTPADSAAGRAQLGRLALVDNGGLRALADVGDEDYSWSAVHQDLVPDQFPDANPNALKVVGNTTYVVDAGTNTLDSVDRTGRVNQLVFFPNPAQRDAVPTCVDRGPDGALYIGELAPGAPLNQGNIYRYDLATHHLSVWKTGFNVVDGCGFDHHGNFYVVEFQANGFNPGPSGNPAGDIIKITPEGTRTVLGAGQLFFPQGFTSDNAGNIFVSNWSIFPGTPARPGMPTGQVVQLKG